MKATTFLRKLAVLLLGAFAFPASVFAALVAHWNFDGNTTDITGNGHDVTAAVNTSFTTDRFGNPNKAAFFAGDSASYMTVDNVPDFNPTDFSISMWVNALDETPVFTFSSVDLFANYRAFQYGDGYALGIFLESQGAIIQTVASRSENNLVSPDGVFNFQEWFMLTATYESTGDMNLYINGQLSATIASAPYNPSSLPYLTMGGSSHVLGPTHSFVGSLDDVMFFDHALTADEVKALVPLPATFPLLAFALAGLALIRRRLHWPLTLE